MENRLEKDTWVYVAVENPGGEESFAGLYNKEYEISYIPVFLEKDDAQSCFLNMPRDPGKKYEIQAVLAEDLAQDAADNGFLIFILDRDGKIKNKIEPSELL